MIQDLAADYPDDPGMPPMQLAQAYFVIQKFDGLFPPAQALCEGTIFPEFLGPRRYAAPAGEESGENYE